MAFIDALTLGQNVYVPCCGPEGVIVVCLSVLLARLGSNNARQPGNRITAAARKVIMNKNFFMNSSKI